MHVENSAGERVYSVGEFQNNSTWITKEMKIYKAIINSKGEKIMKKRK